MSINPISLLTTAAALSAAAVGGLFYGFSTFTMRGLSRTDPRHAITAMRGINAEAQANTPFLMMFIGSSVLALAVGAVACAQLDRPGSAYLLAGAALSVLSLVVTVVFNVPLNNRLDGVTPDGLSAAEAARVWVAYYGPWTAWNHVRTAAPLVGAALLLAGARYR